MKQYYCYCIGIIVFLFLGLSVSFGQSSTWNGISWSNGAPSGSTGSYTFYVDAGTNCIIGSSSMSALYIRNSGTRCTITGVVTANTVVIEYGNATTKLSTNGTLNVTNLTVGGIMNGSGTVNFNGGTYSQTFDGINSGNISTTGSFNVLSGAIVFPYPYAIEVQNMTVASGANVTINNFNYNIGPLVNGTLTINGNFTNNYSYYDAVAHRTIYFTMANLIINSTGSYNSSNGNTKITRTFNIGGSITPAGSSNSYFYDYDNSGTTNELDVFGTANLKFSDLTHSDPTFNYLSTLKVYGGGQFTIDNDLIINTLTINASGTVTTSGTPNFTVNSSIDPIAGRLILPGATFAYAGTSLTVNGTNSAIAYLNKSNYTVTLTGTTDTIRNCTLQQVTVNSGAKGYVSNGSAYKIQRIDAADQVTIASLPKNDTIQISATGSAILTGSARVGYMVDIATGGSLTSIGNLTMLDQSNLYFTTDGQIVGNIIWHRKYGSNGWIYMGVPFPNLTRALVGSGGISQQTIYMNKYVESRISPRWVGVGTSETLGVGTGYVLSMGSTITNDTLVFTGHPQLQTVTVSGLTYTYSNGSDFDFQRGYNLVANPYTAPISVSGFFADNPSLNKIYYWDNQGQSKGVYVTRTSSGIFTPDISALTPKNQAKISASYLSPNQGFFVKLDSTNYLTTTSVTFNPSSVTKNLNNNFLKSTPVYLRLCAKNNSGTKNDIVFQFNSVATANINSALDFSKLVSDTYPLEIYSIKKGGRFSIQSVKIDTALHVPIGLIVKNSEKHSLLVNNFDALPAGVNIYLKDKVANRMVNLKDSAFTVTLTAGTYENRFEVVFKNDLATDINQPVLPDLGNNPSGSSVTVRTQYGQVYLDFSNQEKNVNVQICDISGRIIFEKYYNQVEGSSLLDSNFSLHKVYIARISGDSIFKICKFAMQ